MQNKIEIVKNKIEYIKELFDDFNTTAHNLYVINHMVERGSLCDLFHSPQFRLFSESEKKNVVNTILEREKSNLNIISAKIDKLHEVFKSL